MRCRRRGFQAERLPFERHRMERRHVAAHRRPGPGPRRPMEFLNMSMPSFPPNGADMTREEALTMIIASIAMEELALSHKIGRASCRERV